MIRNRCPVKWRTFILTMMDGTRIGGRPPCPAMDAQKGLVFPAVADTIVRHFGSRALAGANDGTIL
jgi:hypothetical protein